MSKRFFLIVCMLLTLPVTARAKEAPNAADNLGPQTRATQPGSSNADAAALQPAGNNPLQSTTGASTGLTAPSANALQAPVTNDAQLQILSSESDGTPHEVANETTSHWGWLWWSLLVGFATVATFTVWRDRQRFRDHHPTST